MAVKYVNLCINDLISSITDASPDLLFTSQSGNAQINSSTVTNNSGSSAELFIYVLPTGVAATSVDPAWRQVIAADSTVSLDGLIGKIVPNLGTIVAYADTTAVLRVTIDGITQLNTQ